MLVHNIHSVLNSVQEIMYTHTHARTPVWYALLVSTQSWSMHTPGQYTLLVSEYTPLSP